MMAIAPTRTICWLLNVFVFILLYGSTSGLVQAQVNDGKMSFSTGMDVSHAYFFRGIKQERGGFISQPYADVSLDIYSDDDGQGLSAVSFALGQWNSLHSGPTGAAGPAENVGIWYESDFYTGFTLAIDNWEAAITYTSYMSPNDTFGTTQELSLGLSMDDSTLLENFALSPHILLAIETSGGADGGASEGVYLEVGVEPGLDIIDGTAAVSFPVTLGVSLSNYYENGIDKGVLGHFNDGIGFYSIGALISVPLPVPEDFGSWELTGGFHLLSLGGYLESLNDGDQVQAIGSFGVSIGY